MFDPETKLVEALDNAREMIDRAIAARDRGERAFHARMAELYVKIARELETLQ